MTIASLIVVFVIVWWLVLFMALPVGVVTEENPEAGNMKEAPKNPNLKKKLIVTTLITIILTILYYFAIENGWIVFGIPNHNL
jgi:predicted secreted protein